MAERKRRSGSGGMGEVTAGGATGSGAALRTLALVALLLVAGAAIACAPEESAPRRTDFGARTVRFLAIGDFGTGKPAQQEVADAMCAHLEREPFDFMVSTGDNVYPDGEPSDFERKFFEPYECLTDQGVRWHSTLGNHDIATAEGRPQIEEPAFGMAASYYTWRLGPIAFVMLDSNELDSPGDEQIAWMEDQLRDARDAPWTVVVFHEPVYSAGKHGSTPRFDTLLADRFEELGVDIVLNGHDHVYASAFKDGIPYVVTGGGGAPVDRCQATLPPEVETCIPELHFLEVEASESSLTTTAITPDGRTLDHVEADQNQ
jgi:3',5'-cyclic AMP phosphodiesterase CpdA